MIGNMASFIAREKRGLEIRPGGVAPEDRAVFILGMHRSGTSCLAGTLQQWGLQLAEAQTSNPFNLKGNRENIQVMRLNDAVLAHSGGSWHEPPRAVAWSETHATERDGMIARLSDGASGAWGFKDPRTLLVMPFWQEALPNARKIGTFRHPAQVARSLHARGKMAPDDAFRLWADYNRILLEMHRRDPFPLLSFDRPQSDYLAHAARAAGEIGLRPEHVAADAPFYDPDLRHDDAAGSTFDAPTDTMSLYRDLVSASGEPAP